MMTHPDTGVLLTKEEGSTYKKKKKKKLQFIQVVLSCQLSSG